MYDPQARQNLVSTPAAGYDRLRHVTPEGPCPYLSGRLSRSEAYGVDRLEPAHYERLMARGFRRSGRMVYRPRCRGCEECRQLRVPVATFKATRSQRRVQRRNADVRVLVGTPEPSLPKFELFRAYLEHQHDDTMARSSAAFEEFLYDSPTNTLEFLYVVGERLVGVSLADRVPHGLSSVYMFFDPVESRRSLGTFSALWEIEWCRHEGLSYYYLGFHVPDAQTMAYKARFRPHEILVADDRWITLHV